MNLLLDSSVWIEHLRSGGIERLLPRIRGRFLLFSDSIVMAEFAAGCRSKRERRTVARLFLPFARAGRVVSPNQNDFERAGLALSRLREKGRTLSNPGGALLDGLIACCAIRVGALLVTTNFHDFAALGAELPLRVEPLAEFERRLPS